MTANKNHLFLKIILFMFALFSLIIFTDKNALCDNSYSQTSRGDNSSNIVAKNSIVILYGGSDKDKLQTNNENFLFNIQYMRAFGALKVPLFMKYLVEKETNSRIIAAPEFEKYWEERWKKPLYPITNNIWKEIVEEEEPGAELYARAIEPDKEDVINFYLKPSVIIAKDKQAEESEQHRKAILEEGFGVKIDQGGTQKRNGIDEKEIGFLFIILENITDHSCYDIELIYHEIKNELPITPVTASLSYPDEDVFKLNWASRRAIALKDSEIPESKKVLNTRRIASIDPGEAVIWLLSIYRAKKDGMPDYYLTDVQIPLKINFLGKNQRIDQEIRPPYGLQAARLALPRDWFSMRAWVGQ